MGEGLKEQWGVKDPAKAGSDKQAQEFKAAFQPLINAINSALQYTSANAEAAKHQPLEARRDALYPAYQGALAQIDPKNPDKAKSAIEHVLAEAKALAGESKALKAAAEKALADWKTRQPKYDHAVHQVEELEAWGDPKAPALRAVIDGIRTQTNDRRYAPASATVDQLLPKLKPIYDDYLKQRDAKPKYEQMRAEQSARFDPLKAQDAPSQPMIAKTGEVEAALQSAQGKAEAKDFVNALAVLTAAKGSLDALDKMAHDPERTKFLADWPAVEAEITSPGETFKTLEADWQAILQQREAVDAPAQAGNYGAANKILADLKTKLAAYKLTYEALKADRDAYQPISERIEQKMAEVSDTSYPPQETGKADILAGYAKMQEQAAAENFKDAAATGTGLEASINTLLQERQRREQIKANIRTNLPAMEKEAGQYAGSTSPMKGKIDALIASIKAAAAGNDEAALDKAGKDLEQLPHLLEDLKKTEEVKSKLNAATTPEEKKKAAQKAVDDLDAKGGLANLPMEARNLLIEEMMKGTVSAKDTAAINKIWANPQIDPNFDSVDKPIRDKIIKTYAEDPKVLEYRKNWGKMTADQKKEAIKYLTKIPCGPNGWNVGDPTQFDFFDKPKAADGDILYGSYNHDTGHMEVNLNNDAHGRFDELLDTLAHEIGHKQQGVLIDQFRNGTLKPGDANYDEAKALSLCDQYRRNQNAAFNQVYSTSPEEAHSRQMGSELQEEMRKKFPPKPKPVHGGGH